MLFFGCFVPFDYRVRVNIQLHHVCLQWVTSSMNHLAPLIARHFQRLIVFHIMFMANKIWWWWWWWWWYVL